MFAGNRCRHRRDTRIDRLCELVCDSSSNGVTPRGAGTASAAVERKVIGRPRDGMENLAIENDVGSVAFDTDLIAMIDMDTGKVLFASASRDAREQCAQDRHRRCDRLP